MTGRIAASLALPDTEICLAALHQLSPQIGLAEIRLDRMDTFNLQRLIREAPCPLIMTCRPPRQGGRFTGPETERLDILTEAMNLACAYIDVEWDSLATLAEHRRSPTKLIASRHWADHAPATTVLWSTYETLRERADVVKLVGTAQRPADVLPIFSFLQRAASPVIGLAMGQAGQLTRLLSPCFTHSLLTYGAHTPADATAPGQLTVGEMVDRYNLQAVGPHTAIHLHLCAGPASTRAVVEKNRHTTPGKILHVPLVVSPQEAAEVVSGLAACLPRLTVTAEPPLLDNLPRERHL